MALRAQAPQETSSEAFLLWYTKIMSQKHERRTSESPYIDSVWQSAAMSDGTYLVTPDGSWDLIAAIKADGSRVVFITGQASRAERLDYKRGEQSVVIQFAAGAYLTSFKGAPFTDSFVTLPLADDMHFQLDGHTFAWPTFENAEELIEQMVRLGVLASDIIVKSELDGTPKAASKRSIERHFKETTGLTSKKLADIRRAQEAVRMLKGGKDPAATAADAGYYDQPHLSRSLKKLMDSLPSDVDDITQV
jgi:hypothetical protein